MIRSTHKHGAPPDVGVLAFTIPLVNPRPEGGALVAITIAMVPTQSEPIRCGQRGHVCLLLGVGVTVARPCQSRFDRTLVPESRQSSMLGELILVNSVGDAPGHPSWLIHGTRPVALLGKFAHGISVAPGPFFVM